MGTFYYKTCRIKIETFKKMSYKRLAERRHGTTILIISTPAPFLRIRITVWTAMVGTRFFFSKLINPTPFLEKYINWKMFVQLLYVVIAQQFCQFHFGNTLTILLSIKITYSLNAVSLRRPWVGWAFSLILHTF